MAHVNTGEIATFDPAGWISNVGGGAAKTARGHLLGRLLGGAGLASNPNSVKNIVPICQKTTNLSMENQVEIPIKDRLQAGEVADYDVRVTYGDPAHPAVPDSIIILAKAFNCLTGVCTTYSLRFSNRTDLTTCP
jgi:hypothetical protein